MNPDALTRDIIIEKLGFKTETERLEIMWDEDYNKRTYFDAQGDIKEMNKFKSTFRGLGLTYHILRKCGFFETL